MKRSRAFAGVALATTTAAVVWWLGAPHFLSVDGAEPGQAQVSTAAPTTSPGLRSSARPMDSSFFAARRAANPEQSADPLLVHGLRDWFSADPVTLYRQHANRLKQVGL